MGTAEQNGEAEQESSGEMCKEIADKLKMLPDKWKYTSKYQELCRKPNEKNRVKIRHLRVEVNLRKIWNSRERHIRTSAMG